MCNFQEKLQKKCEIGKGYESWFIPSQNIIMDYQIIVLKYMVIKTKCKK